VRRIEDISKPAQSFEIPTLTLQMFEIALHRVLFLVYPGAFICATVHCFAAAKDASGATANAK